ncbi:putative Qb-SNARE protein [Leishmania major strain Friedlin]|uniref:Putative Qb-SNARE protein n=1 Tax=Leishmania major TaxID=5664 RepID=Q4QDM0_LEIMA|nr:putative Qb-SNARE protein [Leishmania major strain Friedlin]CAG9572687.1 Qb-SNARE_protein_-_putative [Leishmania major strain Friedlin]CAJ07086.1 putative Qb-SNARE protein [Leishmania major strain Friedlin]|eukprot:XP_001682578.1 putative Qb-SNARE protein [Leishmania major strain Friedlin]
MAGAKDERENRDISTDPFQDLTNNFVRAATRAKNNINERNNGCRQHGQDHMAIVQSNEIRKDLRLMEETLEEIHKLVLEAERRLAKENKKKKPKESKINLLERDYEGRRSQYDNCVSAIQNLKEMEAQRVEVARTEINTVQEMQFGKRAQLRQQLLGMRRKDNGSGETVGPGDVELVDSTVGGGTLQEHEESKEQMKMIAAQDAKIDAGLCRIKEGVGRLHDLAVQIGAQIDMQNAMLDETEQVIDKDTAQLRGLNRRLKTFLKETRPMNCFLYVCCVFLIVALTGFFLVQFNVI